MSDVLPQSFYARDALVVAEALLGKLLRHDDVVLRITEVEAYCHPDDSASHCRMGRTPRNEPMWGPGGHAYVYLCYGMHNMLNVVTNAEGEGAAVLIRSCEPVAGLDVIAARRGMPIGPAVLTGPGKVAAALALDTSFSGRALFRRSGLRVLDADPPSGMLVGPRVGIAYASAEHQAALWRFASAGTPYVTQARALRVSSPQPAGEPKRPKRS
ncbi:MAG TPA: DNA-3-methyladenine glycosylase [Polyangiales bacterium]|nr:DNA-3-methyladenine glycosylase [Polyangiales bacterium]